MSEELAAFVERLKARAAEIEQVGAVSDAYAHASATPYREKQQLRAVARAAGQLWSEIAKL